MAAKNMTRLSFKDNLLSGPIPSFLGEMAVLQDLTLEKNTLTGVAPPEICALREKELRMFVTDCPSRGGVGVNCSIDDCCTFCRRGESAN